MPTESRVCPECSSSKRIDTLIRHISAHKTNILQKMDDAKRVYCRTNKTPFLIIGDIVKPSHVVCLICKKGSFEGSQRGDTLHFLKNHITESNACNGKWELYESYYNPVSVPRTTGVPKVAKKRVIKKLTSKVPIKTLSIDDWISTMPDLFKFVKDKMNPSVKRSKMTIIDAPVKSGKRKMVECYASFTYSIGETPRIVHFFVSSFVRRADDDQREELRAYLRGGDVLMINSTRRTDDAIEKIKLKIRNGCHVILHFDELDYGSQYDSLMSRLYYEFQNEPNVKYIMYSATPEEAVANKCAVSKEFYPCEIIPFNPPTDFCGPAWFLDRNLVRDCDLPFNSVTNTFSAQFIGALSSYRTDILTNNSKRRLVIARVQDLRALKAAKSSFPTELCSTSEFGIKINYASSITELRDMEVKWDDYQWWKDNVDMFLRSPSLWIIFLEDQSTRSTDWFCHPWLRAYFDYHSDKSCLNTLKQSGERVNFYKHKRFGNNNEDVYKGEEHLIDVYASKKVFEYSAGRLNVKDLDIPLTNRMIVKETSQKWALPIVLELTPEQLEELKNDSRLGNNLDKPLNESLRTIYHKYLIQFAEKNKDEEVISDIRNKTLKYKRVHKPDESGELSQGGIVTVAKNWEAKYPSQPGGGFPGTVNTTEYCIDIALDDIPYEDADGEESAIYKGIVFITIPTSKPQIDNGLIDKDNGSESDSSDGTEKHLHRTTKKSMFANSK
jgi:hypothetical protein